VSEPRDFWLACGHHLLDRDAAGRLTLTDEFLKAYLARPELRPPSEACAAERDIHRALLADPRMPIATSRLAVIADRDARDNWQVMMDWRDFLVAHASLEAAYLDLVRRGRKFPHLFINQLIQVILRNILDGCEDAFVLRAAELFFRPQTIALLEGSLIAADGETVADRGAAPVSPLSSLLGRAVGAEFEVLSETNACTYWERSDQFDLALDLTGGRRGLKALGDVIAGWVAHLLKVEVNVLPVTELNDVALTWYVGLDAEATLMGDSLWDGAALDEATQARLVGLYRIDFDDGAIMNERLSGAPSYLIMAMTKDRSLRLKPQNLLTGLPLRQLDIA
jgi:hypothetical protein